MSNSSLAKNEAPPEQTADVTEASTVDDKEENNLPDDNHGIQVQEEIKEGSNLHTVLLEDEVDDEDDDSARVEEDFLPNMIPSSSRLSRGSAIFQ